MALLTSSRVRLIAILLTICVVAAPYLLPTKTLRIFPSDATRVSLYSDGDWGGDSRATWVANSGPKLTWRCELIKSESQPVVCGFVIMPLQGTKAIDASGYSGVHIKLRYSGDARFIRVYIRTFDPRVMNINVTNRHSFSYQNIPVSELNREIDADLAGFQIADWSFDDRAFDESTASKDFKHISSIGIDFPSDAVFGQHELTLESIEFTGAWVSAEYLYLAVILSWLAGLLLESTLRTARWKRIASENLKQVKDLTDYAQQLRATTDRYRELSHIDILTEVYNRYGFMQTLKKLFGRGALNGCLMVIDIDFFKRINDNYGHMVGDRYLHQLAQLFATNIRKGDVFARWGGEEFVLLVTNYDIHQALALAEKLRYLVEHNEFDASPRVPVTVSIGLTSFTKTDSLNTAFIRADEALYRAKEQGRNRVVVSASIELSPA